MYKSPTENIRMKLILKLLEVICLPNHISASSTILQNVSKRCNIQDLGHTQLYITQTFGLEKAYVFFMSIA